MIKKITIMLLTLMICACTNVQPWEREYLAKDEMQFSQNKLSASLHKQIHESKEASSGSGSAAGTGCGCN